MEIEQSVKKTILRYGMDKRYLLAMSGGVDSVSAFYLMKNLGVNFAVAHVNYGLRGEASDLDEQFVKDICLEYGITCHAKQVDLSAYKSTHNDSTQSAARKLRYEWFDDLLQEFGFDYLITAHHLDDSIETFFINLLRGTGLRGLTGIESHDTIIRPLLCHSKDEILAYAQHHNLSWREDASNATNDYVRNKIRHNVVPELREINTNFDKSFLKTIQFLQDDVALLQEYVQKTKDAIFVAKKDWIEISIKELKAIAQSNLLFYLFEDYGFKHPQEIIKLLDAAESSEINSKFYRLLKNRESLILLPNDEVDKGVFEINDLDEIHEPVHLRFELRNQSFVNKLPLLDYNSIKFPLSLRLRKSGDVFFPKGMGGKSKKVSKFYKDLKLSKVEKENTWLLCDADNRIIWVVGKRFDERFLETKETKKWLGIIKLD